MVKVRVLHVLVRGCSRKTAHWMQLSVHHLLFEKKYFSSIRNEDMASYNITTILFQEKTLVDSFTIKVLNYMYL